MSNHAYKNSEKIQIIFIDKLIINPQFIGSRQTHHKRVLHRIDLQEHRGELCIENQRERRSHLPISYRQLLTLHWKGNGVDVETLRDRIPLWQDAGKGSKMGYHGYRRLRRWKSGAPPEVFRVYEYIYRRTS